MTLLILSLSLALGVSFLCSLMEAMLLSLRPGQIADISLKQPQLGTIWKSFKTNIERPIGVILIINTTAHTIGASMAGAEFDKLYGNQWLWVFSLVFTVVMVQFSEILPKTLGVRFNRRLALMSARPLHAITRILSPILKLIHWINRPFQMKHKAGEGGGPNTVEEIAALAGLARISQQIGLHQERIIKGASRLSKLSAGEIMIPVDQVSFLSTTQTISEALEFAHVDAHTRFPVCEKGDRNRVAGYVNFKEIIGFMRTNPNDPSLKGVTRPLVFVEEETLLPSLLEIFMEQHAHMAIVRKKSGETLGMITLEDIVEELVGDIRDEFDLLPKYLQALSGESWMVGGGASMEEVSKAIGLKEAEETIPLVTWMEKRLEGPPAPGKSYREGEFLFTIRRIRRGKIYDVVVSRKN